MRTRNEVGCLIATCTVYVAERLDSSAYTFSTGEDELGAAAWVITDAYSRLCVTEEEELGWLHG